MYLGRQITVNNAVTHYNLKTTGLSGSWTTSKVHEFWIMTDKDLTIHFNSTTNNEVFIPKDSWQKFQFVHDGKCLFDLTNVYITNASGSNASVKIFLQDNKYV